MIKAVLTDIEGTTTSVSFVYDVLFPYFTENMESLLEMLHNAEVRKCFDNVKQVVNAEEGKKIDDAGVIEQLKKWVVEDRKESNLKQLQGIIWKSAYESGKIKGHVYDDVPVMLEKWNNDGIKLAVYSSGSVAAQKLLFGFSIFGDLNPYFSVNFDTKMGYKREKESYLSISKQLEVNPNEILFLSDIEEELNAAEQIGYHTIQLVRKGTQPSSKHINVRNFTEIDITKF